MEVDAPPPEPPRPKSKGRSQRNTGPAIPDEGLGGIVAPVRAKAPRVSSPTPATRMPARSGESSPDVSGLASSRTLSPRRSPSQSARWEAPGNPMDDVKLNGTANRRSSSSGKRRHSRDSGLNGKPVGDKTTPSNVEPVSRSAPLMPGLPFALPSPAVPGFAWHHSSSYESPPPWPIPLNLGAAAPFTPLPFNVGISSPLADFSRPMSHLSSYSTDMSYAHTPMPIPLHSWQNGQHLSRGVSSAAGYGSAPASIQAPMTYTNLASYPSYPSSVRMTTAPARRSTSFPPSYSYRYSSRSPGRTVFSGARLAGPSRNSRSRSPAPSATSSPRLSLPPTLRARTLSPRQSLSLHGSATVSVPASLSHRQNMYATHGRSREYQPGPQRSPFTSPFTSPHGSPRWTSKVTNGTRRYPASKSPGTSPYTSPRWQVPPGDGPRRHPGSKSPVTSPPVTSPHSSPRWQVPPADGPRRQKPARRNSGAGSDSGSKSPPAGRRPSTISLTQSQTQSLMGSEGENFSRSWRNGAHPSSSAQSQALQEEVCENERGGLCRRRSLQDEILAEGGGNETNGLHSPTPLPISTGKTGAKKTAPPPIPASKAGSRWQRETDRLGSYEPAATIPSEEGMSL